MTLYSLAPQLDPIPPANGGETPRFRTRRMNARVRCTLHGALAWFDSASEAQEAALRPEAWCRSCAAMVEAEEGRQ